MDKKSSLYCYKYPHPAVTADCVVITYDNDNLEILLIKRRNPPFQNHYALPGGFIAEDETTLDGAKRELFEETGIKNVLLYETKSYSDPHRDPRERIITIAHLAIVNKQEVSIKAGDDAKEADWFLLKELPPLAFDHNTIIEDALKKLKQLLFSSPILQDLLPDPFTITDFKNLLEKIIDREIDDFSLEKLLKKLCTSQINNEGKQIFKFIPDFSELDINFQLNCLLN